MKNKNRVLVIGGTGRLGRPVVDKLLLAGFNVRVLTRDPVRASQNLPEEVEIYHGNVEDRSSLIDPMRDCDGIHLNLNGAAQKRRYFEIEYEGTLNVVRMAENSGVKHITMISGSTVNDEIKLDFVQAKAKAEKVLLESKINATIFRASAFMETIPMMIRGPFGIVLGKQPYPFNLVSAKEFAEKVALVFDSPEKFANVILQAYGPEKLYLKVALKSYVKIKAPGKLVLQVPLFMMWLPSKFMGSEIAHIYDLTKHFEDVPEPASDSISTDLLGSLKITFDSWLKE